MSQLLDNVDGSSSIDSRGPRGPYNVLTPAQKYKIGKKAAEIGTTAAMRYYSKHYPELLLKGTSVRRFKTNYQADLKERLKMPEEDSEGTVRELVPKKRGRPLLIGEKLDGQVREYVTEGIMKVWSGDQCSCGHSSWNVTCHKQRCKLTSRKWWPHD